MNNKHNTLYLVWNDPKTHENFIVGSLVRDEVYKFEYFGGYKEAQNRGWDFLPAFPQDAQYECDVLFPVFSSRLPDKKRKGIEEILAKYGLPEYDEFELLRAGGGKLPIDSYSFIDPIFPEDETIEKEFYIAGFRFYAGCTGEYCNNAVTVRTGDGFELRPEPDNPFDTYAVALYSVNGVKVGYIPNYYSESVTKRINMKMTYSCEAIEVNMNSDCTECIKVRLIMPKR